ncbi:concanavalin A-like lectin/glucanase domain-containing protein [Lentinula raphanica]|uniref:Concanavalin A-like lectin/glucanase domain-containing protein n=1 Tax=Lentinula raphanica TaxID=153919 RepID=A0AA38UC96_9AGAR|nr:concanavalin A-like lectin/glucanase domain-containing protein [Lentinula raphanica]KAJ3836310.1 concanavalin A-like lectin/glucanase domain-containing protein [Lentinula raphanica]
MLAATFVLISIFPFANALPTLSEPSPPNNDTVTLERRARNRVVADSPIWAGLAIFPPEGERFTTVTGIITLPQIPNPLLSIKSHVAFWVGLDGDSGDHPHFLQAGIHAVVEDGGVVKYRPWVQWFPEPPIMYDPSSLNTKAGDRIQVEVRIEKDGSEGFITLTNKSNHRFLTRAMVPTGKALPVRGEQAEWIVEHPLSDHGLPLPKFEDVIFSRCYASTDKSTRRDLSDPRTLYRLKPPGSPQITDVELSTVGGSSTFKLKHL